MDAAQGDNENDRTCPVRGDVDGRVDAGEEMPLDRTDSNAALEAAVGCQQNQ